MHARARSSALIFVGFSLFTGSFVAACQKNASSGPGTINYPVAHDPDRPLSLRVDVEAGELEIAQGDCTKPAFHATWPSGPGPKMEYDEKNAEFWVDFDHHRKPRKSRSATLGICLPRSQPMQRLRVEQGAGELRWLTPDLNIESLELELGAGEMTVDLSRSRRAERVELQLGAGDLQVHLPSDSPVVIFLHRGIADVQTSGLKSPEAGIYVNDAYRPSNAASALEIDIDFGVGSLRLTADPKHHEAPKPELPAATPATPAVNTSSMTSPQTVAL